MSDIKEPISVRIEEEIKKSYLSYATSVIVSRALPDVRDGLKPVNRRILYAMMEAGCLHDRPYRKSARVVGDVLGKYHPHGRDAVYEAMVRLAQDFSMRVMLVDGQGNFGSMDGDKAAADRYTEVRLKLSAHYLLEDYDKDTVDFTPNYDNSLMMPEVLPARFPHVLVNGASGIAVGMATNIPPHNLGEIVDACCLLIDDPQASLAEVMQHVHGPDFPTGGLILGEKGLSEAYKTGKGTIYIRGRCSFEQVAKDRTAIIISEIPYQVNKARLVENIAALVREKELEGISDLRDESDREGVRVVIELKRDATPEVVLNRLYTTSQLQVSFGISLRALDHGRPVRMGLIPILNAFLEFRKEVVLRRTRYYLRKARERALLLWGLFVAVLNVDEVVACIRAAADPQEARDVLVTREWQTPLLSVYSGLWQEVPDESLTYRLSVDQAKAILDLRLHRLTRLEKDKILSELQQLIEDTQAYRHILESHERLKEVMKEELLEVKKILGSPRRTTLSKEWTCDTEDLIEREEMVVTASLQGFIKRVPLDSYRAQRRGGKGRAAMAFKDQDALSSVFVANTHTALLFFSSLGRTYKLKVYDLPLGSPQARGRPLVNVFPLWAPEESLAAIVPISEESDSDLNTVIFATSRGGVRRNAFSDFANLKVQGRMAMRFNHPDEKISGVSVCRDDQDILLTTRQGKCLRFPINVLRQFSGRTSTGVKGINLAEGDEVISMAVLDHVDFSAQERAAYLQMMSARRRQNDVEGGENCVDEGLEDIDIPEELALTDERSALMEAQEQFILTVSENGYGKRTSAYAYRCAGRGGQGVAAIEVNLRNGPVVHALPVQENDQILLLTLSGQMIRCPVKDIRITGRTASGVTLLRAEDKVRSVFPVPGSLEELSSDQDESDTHDDSLFDKIDEINE